MAKTRRDEDLLTPAQKRLARRLASEGYELCAIADRYGLTESALDEVLNSIVATDWAKRFRELSRD
ncbi:hypothetical protein NA8A_05623 [Nitratireductor indicus C115]|uniref:Uncharacterized protein n=1 Tax=Nitratireductor indicus C115 TaxID=1231190 RepID=K2P8C8_9HYPH|nr:hypothetical protein [Nitratireductor indicus]EKF43486.1 hypothetical protein NA8A_05623 [Nitratireductor indicus C115]SFQ06583.1 hypothetical protein SAMN05216176_101181 [Nitratireductor indicus]